VMRGLSYMLEHSPGYPLSNILLNNVN
jgi:hypothetical protein